MNERMIELEIELEESLYNRAVAAAYQLRIPLNDLIIIALKSYITKHSLKKIGACGETGIRSRGLSQYGQE